MTTRDRVTTAQAADVLGISQQRVARLAVSGRFGPTWRVGSAILIDRSAVHRLNVVGRAAGRPWAQTTAWAAMVMLSGGRPEWLDAPRRSKLKSKLRHPVTDAKRVRQLSQAKDRIVRYRSHPSLAERIARNLFLTGTSALADEFVAHRFGLVPASIASAVEVEGYISSDDVGSLIAENFLREDPDGNVILHVVEEDRALRTGRTPLAAIAVDLMSSLATREQSAGARVLGELLEQFGSEGS